MASSPWTKTKTLRDYLRLRRTALGATWAEFDCFFGSTSQWRVFFFTYSGAAHRKHFTQSS